MYIVRKTDLPLIGSSYNFVGADHGNVPVSVYLLEAQPGRGAPLHIHEYDEILFMLEGRSRFVAGDEIREVAAEEIIVVKARTPHGFVNIGNEVLKQLDIPDSPVFKQQNLEPTEVSKKAGLPMPPSW
jgi:mannose-6-phosphate isomerase-like protein (cupin superfamily)